MAAVVLHALPASAQLTVTVNSLKAGRAVAEAKKKRLRLDAHAGLERPREGPRLLQEEDRDRPGGQGAPRSSEAVVRRALVLALAVLMFPASASAQSTYTATTGNDGNDGECANDCTLREAIALATPSDTVILPARLYTLDHSDGPILLNGDTVLGAGARTTVIGGSTYGLFTLGSGTSQMSGVTLTGGNGVRLQGPVAGGAIFGIGSFAPVSLTLTDSTVRGNRAQVGGAIAVGAGATVALVRSTVSGNTSTGANGSHGGAIYIDGGTVSLVNSTVSGNTATDGPSAPGNADGGGVYINAGTLTVQNATFANNRATGDDGLFREPQGNSTVTLNSTIVDSGPNRNACAGAPSFFRGDHNLSDDFSCGFTEPSDKVADAQLGSLGDNGGPTDTHALSAGSVAIGSGSGCPATDQRGVARDGACDIGAFEYVAPAPPQPSGGGEQPPPEGEQLPAPIAGESVNVAPTGAVRVKRPGSKGFIALSDDEQLPIGTIIDTRKGRVALTAAGDQKASFYDGIFRIGQGKGARPLTTLTLVEKLSCGRGRGAVAAAKAKRKRRLWGDGKGRFRTRGEHSAATVVGTRWLVEDRCTSTLTRVVRGRVSVRDFATKKTVIVRAGKKYVAKARKR